MALLSVVPLKTCANQGQHNSTLPEKNVIWTVDNKWVYELYKLNKVQDIVLYRPIYIFLNLNGSWLFSITVFIIKMGGLKFKKMGYNHTAHYTREKFADRE